MTKLIDITGNKYNMLTVIERVGKKWKCECDCGNITYVSGGNLKYGGVKSCGCLLHKPRYKHNQSHTKLYHIWSGIKNRCTNPNFKGYKYYGAKGISVCEEWMNSFESFRDWALDNGYEENLTIERLDNNLDYCPSNCKWATRKEQSRNRSSNIKITYNGETKILTEWCEELGLEYKRTHNRIYKLGWTYEKAFTTPVDVSKRNKR